MHNGATLAVPFKNGMAPDDDLTIAASEIDHRIANHLSMIAGLVRMRACAADTTAPIDAGAVLRAAATQIDAVGRLHRLLSRRPGEGTVDLGGFLREICDTLSDTVAASTDMTLTQSYAGDLQLSRDRVLPIALVVCEAVANAAKYAHPAGLPGRVHVACMGVGTGGLSISVEDDGVGFPEGFDPGRDGGLGLRVIRALTRQLGGRSTFTTGSLGALYRLDVPATA